MSQGLVMYIDGGCRPTNPGFAGWGLHGYLYDTGLTKKIPGTIGHILTPAGYVLKLGMDNKLVINEVIPVHYLDGFGAIGSSSSNNVAELSAAINGLKHASTYDITEVHLFTDSEYVRKGLDGWVEGWRNNNWLKQDGCEPANVAYWKELIELKDILTQRGVDVKISWVKAHIDILGNVLADKLATIGVISSMRRNIMTNIEVSSPIGYWKSESGEHHPFINHSRMFFNTMPEYIKRGEYFLGETDRDDDSFGQRTSDGAYSVVQLEEADVALEIIRNYQSKIAYGKDSIVMARLDALYRANIYQDVVRYSELAIDQTSPNRLDLYALSKNSDGYEYKEPMTREFVPPKLCMRAVENIGKIAIVLNQYLEKNPDFIVTDITNVLYQDEEKTSKSGVVTTVKKLRTEYVVGFAALKTNMNYQSGSEVASISVILTLGIDLLDRNALKRLESQNVKISIVTWMDAPDVIRYATIAEAGNDKCISCGTYSNRRIVDKVKA